MAKYIHQSIKWPSFTWDEQVFYKQLGELRQLQGKLLGKVELLGFELKDEANLETLIIDVVKTSEIEGEVLQPEFVRSSIAKRLGLADNGIAHSERNIDGIVDLMIDATQQNDKSISEDRLFGWHAALFPTGRSGMYKIEVGQWRSGDLQVDSGAMGRERVHFEAPKAEKLPEEMHQFINWFNSNNSLDSILKAAIAHLWFITIHPFDDGNGRIARALTDMQLSVADGINQRFYSMSSQINKQKKSYYAVLESTQKGELNVTDWILWFIDCLKNAILDSQTIIDRVVYKHQFWAVNAHLIYNARQQFMLNKLLDGFQGNLTSSKWAKMTKCSPDTALRDITDLISKDILEKASASGRSTHYVLKNSN
jgi:Fic family protein